MPMAGSGGFTMRSLRVSMIGVYRIDTAGVESAEIKTAQLQVAGIGCVKARVFLGVA
jgi:hypothetical protein